MRGLDRFQVCDALGITLRQLSKLQRSPAFPKPYFEGRVNILWRAEDIDAFREQMDRVERQGWQVPQALYPWDTDDDWRRGIVRRRGREQSTRTKSSLD